MTDDQRRALDQCARATQHALAECAKAREPDPREQDLTDPAYRLAVEATQLLAALRDLRGKPPAALWYA